MIKSESKIMHWRDIGIAMSLLSRWPLRLSKATYARSAHAVWAYPVAGGLIALPVAGLALLCLGAGLPTGLSALLALAAVTISTGAIHEDGLADSADGLWGAQCSERRLEIMHDSRVGVYGVLALIFSLAFRWFALTTLFASGAVFGPLVVAAIVSRATPPVLMFVLPHARASGLSRSVGTPPGSSVALGVLSAVVLSILVLQNLFILALVAALLAGTLSAVIAKYKINGQTGDVLGASQQLTEISVLIALTLTP